MRLLVLVLVILFCVTPAAIAAPTVLFTTDSVSVSQEQLDAALPDFQTAVSRDLAPWWGTDAVLTTDPSVPADMTVSITDDLKCFGCLGFHDTSNNHPSSYVGGALAELYSSDWRLVATHELFEMLVDPWINRFASWNRRQYLVEVGDPVESGLYAYYVNDTPITDFILPGWYGAVRNQPVDFTHSLRRPGQIGRHGYVSWLTPSGWKQSFG